MNSHQDCAGNRARGVLAGTMLGAALACFGPPARGQEDCLSLQTIQIGRPPNAQTPTLAVYDSVRNRLVAVDREAHAYEWAGTTWSAIPDALPVLTCAGQPCTVEGATCPNQAGICIREALWGATQSTKGAMGFDRRRGVTVVYSLTDDIREWDGHVWTKKTPSPSPGSRVGAAMTYDPIGEVVVMFGGRVLPGNFTVSDLWEWDGTNWTQRTSATAPPPRLVHGLAFDESRGMLVTYGGRSASSTPFTTYGDVWEWNGADWHERVPENTTALPVGRSLHAMAYDSLRRVTVVTGGSSSTGAVNETWEWDGRIWRERFPPDPPLPLDLLGRTLVYDSGRDMLHAIDGGTFHFAIDYASPPEITQGPASLAMSEGQPAAFSVTTVPSTGVDYQWRRNGLPIPGATSGGYGIAAVMLADQGIYDVEVSLAGHDPFPPCGVRVSGAASLIVQPAVPADLNGDGVVDLLDFAEFESSFTGPGP